MSALHDVLAARRDELLARWESCIRASFTLGKMPHVELIDHMPSFLDDLVRALEQHDGRHASNQPSEHSEPAAVHGQQRLRQGFDVSAVVCEYGVLHRCLLELMDDLAVPIGMEEHRVITGEIVTGIAAASEQYVRGREEDRRRMAAEQFSFFAHDLRNTLSSATMAVSLLKADPGPGHARALVVLERNLARATQQIEQTLVSLRSRSAGRVERAPVRILDVVQEAWSDCAPLALQREIDLDCDVDPDLEVEGDPTVLRSMLTNLLHNAVKFSRSGEPVSVRARTSSQNVTVEVGDRCGGLPEGKAEELLAPFVQAGTDRSGFGLGLSIVRHGADAHGGTLEVRDQPGVGCVFAITLPR